MITRVIALNSFPVKGCAPVSLQTAQMIPAGLAHDRSFMVIDEQGLFRSQRRDPRLALIQPTVSAEGERLTLRRTAKGGVAFGAKFSVLRGGKLSVGDVLTVTSWADDRQPASRSLASSPASATGTEAGPGQS